MATSFDMNRYVDFKDSPNTTTPISATNLNKIQDGVKNDLSQTTTTLNANISALSSSDYDMLIWIAYVSTDLKQYDTFGISLKGHGLNMASTLYPSAAIYKLITRNSDTSYTLNRTRLNNDYNNNYLVVYKVIGIKLGNS